MVTSVFTRHLQGDTELEGKLRSEGHSSAIGIRRLPIQLISYIKIALFWKVLILSRCANHRQHAWGWLTQRVTCVHVHIGREGVSQGYRLKNLKRKYTGESAHAMLHSRSHQRHLPPMRTSGVLKKLYRFHWTRAGASELL